MRKKLARIIDFSTSSQVAFTIFLEIITGGVIIFVMLGSFLKLAEDVINKETISFDWSIIHFIYQFRSPVSTEIMNSLSFFGGEIFLGTAITLIILFLYLIKHRKDAFIFSFILLFGIGLNFLLKDMFHRPRPHFFPLVHETSYSFPSGHAMNSFIFFTCISFFIFRRMKNNQLKNIFISLSALMILLVGISRIYLGAHYPSDVLAGYVAGLCWFVLVLLFEKTLLFLHLFKRFEFEKKY